MGRTNLPPSTNGRLHAVTALRNRLDEIGIDVSIITAAELVELVLTEVDRPAPQERSR